MIRKSTVLFSCLKIFLFPKIVKKKLIDFYSHILKQFSYSYFLNLRIFLEPLGLCDKFFLTFIFAIPIIYDTEIYCEYSFETFF